MANEIGALNRLVSMYLDYAENQAQQRVRMTMREWSERLDALKAGVVFLFISSSYPEIPDNC